jgi:hypothetical protein
MGGGFIVFGPLALAEYSPTIGDLNAIFDPPMNIQNIICGPMTDESQKSVCKDGVASARWMAEKYAKKAGGYLGCIDGLSQGLAQGYQAGRNPTSEMLAEARSSVAGVTFTSAIERGRRQAAAVGETASADQIIARYRAVIGKVDVYGRPVLPNKEPVLPENQFRGFDDGYSHDVLSTDSGLAAVYQTGWVTPQSPWIDRLSAMSVYSIQQQYSTELCSMDGTIFGRRSMPAPSWWDLFRARGQFNFERYGWNDADWAWDVLIRDDKNLDSYMVFAGIENRTKTVTEPVAIKEIRPKLDANGKAIPKLDAEGKPMLDSYGRPIYLSEEVITGYRNETRVLPLSEAEKKALRNAYLIGFRESYGRYYARQYASIDYHRSALEKWKIGSIIGQGVGSGVARQVARKDAYDQAYKLASATAFAERVRENYLGSFKYLIDIFEKNPVLELNTVLIQGEVADSIFRPGESLYAQFSATNLGEVSRPSIFSLLRGRGVSAVNSHAFSVGMLNSASFTTGILARIDSNHPARQFAEMTFGVSTPGDLKEVARSLVIQKGVQAPIHDYLEIDRADLKLDTLKGEASALIDLVNPAQSSAPILVTEVRLNLGRHGSAASSALSVAGGAMDQRRITIDGIDPLELIRAGGISGVVSTTVAGRVAHQMPVEARVTESGVAAILRYFDALATGKTRNTGKADYGDRVAELIRLLSEAARGDVARNLIWRRESHVNTTWIARIQSTYEESKNANRIDSQAQQAYDRLGASLAKYRDEVKAGGGLRFNRRGNRKHYIEQIRRFAPGAV